MFGKVLRRLAAGFMAFCMCAAAPVAALADDYFAEGEVLDGLVIQIVVQNDQTENNAFKWMNGGAFEEIPYQTPVHIELRPDEGLFADAESLMKICALYISYYGPYSKSEEAQIDVKLTNIFMHLREGTPDVIGLADFDSVEAGMNEPDKSGNYAIIYDFQEQIPDGPTRAYCMQHLDYIEMDIEVSYFYMSDAAQTEEETTTEVETTTKKPKETTTAAPKETTSAAIETTVAADAEVETAAASTEAPAADESSEDKKSLVKTIVAIAFGVVLIGALAGVGVMYMKKK